MENKSHISRKDQARLTKKKIYDTTILLIRKKGYNKITIREICQAAEISVGSFYLYFSSKDEILPEFFRRIDELPLEQDETRCCADRIVGCVRSYLSNMVAHFDKEILRELARTSLSARTEYILADDRCLIRHLREILAQAGARLPAGETPESMCHRIQTFLVGYVYVWLMRDDVDSDPMVDKVCTELRLFLSGRFPSLYGET